LIARSAVALAGPAFWSHPMHIRVLGSAAGGGFPQWNCNCRQCAGVRNGSLRAQRRTQSSIALSDDGVEWVLCWAMRSMPLLSIRGSRRLKRRLGGCDASCKHGSIGSTVDF